MSGRKINILIVEDNLAHLKITEYILREKKVDARFFVVRDGQEAIDFLYHKEEYQDPVLFPPPDLVLLDLNLPQRDGREVLKLVNNDPELRKIPVVIVSTSDRVEDMDYAFANGAVAYISKSSGFETFSEELGSVGKYVKLYTPENK